MTLRTVVLAVTAATVVSWTLPSGEAPADAGRSLAHEFLMRPVQTAVSGTVQPVQLAMLMQTSAH